MESALLITELLQKIFSHLEPKHLSIAATINEKWSESALDVLWRDLDSLYPICQVLQPMVSSPAGYNFARPLDQSSWDRLDKYAYRVRSLASKSALHPGVYDQMARTRPRLNIFPNLRRLEWDSSLLDCLLFMHPTIRHLSLILPENFPTTAGVFSPYLARRLSSIEILDVALKTQTNDIDGLLVSCIEQLSSVNAISLPIAPDKPILEALSRLPHLSKITLKPYNPSTSSPQDFAFGEKAFPELQDVAFSLPYFSATKLLFHPQFPTFLTRIHIDSLSSESPADFSDLLAAIADRNPAVVSVRIISSLVERPSRMEFFDMRHMRPILRCSKLRSLELAHFYPFMLFPPDLEEIASAFPNIETLVVNCSPSDTSEATPSPVPISSIIPFASCCPKLRKLGLYFDGSSSLIPRNQPEHVFPRLITLFVGSSTVSNPRRLAFFLSHICPYVTEILNGKQWIDGLCAAPSKEWEELVTLLPLLSEVRTEERVWAKHQNQN